MEQFGKSIEKIDTCIFKLTDWICRIMLGCQVIICAGIFIGRYFFKYTPAWGESTALFCLVWLCILSSSIAVMNDEHLRMTVFDAKLPVKILTISDMLTTLIIGCFAVFMIKAGWSLVALSKNNIIPGMNLPASYLNMVIPVTGIIYLVALIEQWRRRIMLCHKK